MSKGKEEKENDIRNGDSGSKDEAENTNRTEKENNQMEDYMNQNKAPVPESEEEALVRSVLELGSVGFDPGVDRNDPRCPQDWTQALNVLLCHEGSASARLRLAGLSDDAVAKFFEGLVLGTEPDASEMFIRDVATELRAAFKEHISSPLILLDEHQKANILFKEAKWRQASLHFAKAIFALFATEPIVEEMQHFSETDSTTGDLAVLPMHTLYLDLRLKQVESLFRDDQFQRAALYGRQALRFMCLYKSRDSVGFYGLQYSDRYSALQLYVGDSEMALLNMKGAILSCSWAINLYSRIPHAPSIESDIGSFRQSYFEKMVSYYEEGGGPEEDVERDRAGAKIIVDGSRPRGVTERKQFVVNDLESALRIAKDDDLIFLEEGTYSPKKPPADSNVKKAVFEFRKSVHIVGASTSKSVVSGSLVKWGLGTLRMERLKLEIGLDIDSEDDAYFMEGETWIDSCIVETPVNTAMFVINRDAKNPTKLYLQGCSLDGLENARRLLCFQGPQCFIECNLCSVTGFFSFCTVINSQEVTNGYMGLKNSVLYELQDGVKIIVHHESMMTAAIEGCHFDMCRYVVDLPSHAFSMTGGHAVVRNNRILIDNFDSVGISLHSLKHATIDGVQMDTIAEAPRALALGEGLVLSENLRVAVQRVDITGFRLGIHLSNQFPELTRLFVDSCSFKSCGIGILMRDASKANNGVAPQISSAAAVKAQNQQNFFYRIQFETTHYGIFNDDPRGKIEVAYCEFEDIPRPIVLDKDCITHTRVHDGVYKVSEAFLPSSSEEDASNASGGSLSSSKDDYEVISGKLYLHFATKENLPHRAALDYNRVSFIHNEREQDKFMAKFQTYRNKPNEEEDDEQE